MSTNRVFDQGASPAPNAPLPAGLMSSGFAFCFVAGANPYAMMLQMAAHQQAMHDLAERAKRLEWQQIMARCGIDYQI